jgi:hypothetical protein
MLHPPWMFDEPPVLHGSFAAALDQSLHTLLSLDAALTFVSYSHSGGEPAQACATGVMALLAASSGMFFCLFITYPSCRRDRPGYVQRQGFSRHAGPVRQPGVPD